MKNLSELPENLPIPEDDGACSHLQGMKLPSLALASTDGENIDLSSIKGKTVVYIYPLTGRPDIQLPDGWNEIPGARGCTVQSCSFRDYYSELTEHGFQVYGLSVQDSEYQQEAVARLHLPFPLLSDHAFQFINALSLPIFEFAGMALAKRVTLVINDGTIEKVFYPVFPPDKNAKVVIQYLTSINE